MYGTDSTTGEYLSGLDHLRQSVADIITTPLNSRVMVRGYGCGLFNMVDAPMNAEFRARAVESIFMALARWEPRIKLGKVEVSGTEEGLLNITLTGSISQTDYPYSQVLSMNRNQFS